MPDLPTIENRATSVSVNANRPYLQALKELARRRKTSMARLVRAALDKEYGEELESLSSFFTKIDHLVGQETLNVDMEVSLSEGITHE